MSIEIQQMIRDQANETRTQLHDMVSWEAEIQKRDDQLIELAKQGKFGYVPPDTSRMQATTTTSSKPKKVQIEDAESPSAEKPTEQKKAAGAKAPKSYEEWQKIDGKYKDFDENVEDDPKETATEHKEKGNNFYKKKQYSAAIKEYSTAIRLDPSNAIYFNNRAAAHYQMSNYVESEKDATKALSLDGRYVKAYIRRGNARRVQGKLQGALEDFQIADEIEPGTPEIEKQLASIREQLGISANGLITEVAEPKVKIIQDEDEGDLKANRPKIEVVEEEKREEKREEEEPKKKGPKIEVIEEKSFSPAAEENRNKKESKIEVIEEKSFSPEAKKEAKIEIIEEKSFSPEANQAPTESSGSKIKIVSEEPAAASEPSSRIKIVSEEPTTSSKVKIVSEELATSSKIKIISDEAKEEPAAKTSGANVKIVSEEANKAEPQKTKGDEIPKKQPRPDNIQIHHDELDSEPKPKPKPKPAQKPAAPAQKPLRLIKPFIDVSFEEMPDVLKALKPSQINQAIGNDISEDVVLKVVKGLHGFDSTVAFEFIEQLGKHMLISMILYGPNIPLIRPLVIEIIDSAKNVDNTRKTNVRKVWKIE